MSYAYLRIRVITITINYSKLTGAKKKHPKCMLPDHSSSGLPPNVSNFCSCCAHLSCDSARSSMAFQDLLTCVLDQSVGHVSWIPHQSMYNLLQSLINHYSSCLIITMFKPFINTIYSMH